MGYMSVLSAIFVKERLQKTALLEIITLRYGKPSLVYLPPSAA